tara:strand:- start:3675 stop:3848 length:174 start_codon:yes stop_codon:yes gene_type:complete
MYVLGSSFELGESRQETPHSFRLLAIDLKEEAAISLNNERVVWFELHLAAPSVEQQA